MLYFDHCASTPPREEVIRTFTEVMTRHYANPSSLHRSGVEAGRLIERARDQVAGLFGTAPQEWVFTSGGTESNNLAIKGAARRYRSRGSHLITTAIEHSSVYKAFEQLEREGFRVTFLPVNATGHVDPQLLEEAITSETVLVSVMHVNNEIGSVQPIAEIGRRLKRYPDALFHVDGVQSIGKLPVDLKGWRIDLFSGSAHKLRGPKGAGWLYVREGIALQPLLDGGGQEEGRRSGTPNVPAIVAAAQALRLSMEEQTARRSKMAELRAITLDGLRNIPELVLTGADPHDVMHEMAPHIVHFRYPGMKPEVMIHLLEKHRIIVSTQSACSSRLDKPSRVLSAMGMDQEHATSGIRLSFGDEHEVRDISVLLQMLQMVVGKLKPLERRESRRGI
jgi:cysteine desulfurase